jgi:hypothetical protein
VSERQSCQLNAFNRQMTSDLFDAREGVAAFREKRALDWSAITEELPW